MIAGSDAAGDIGTGGSAVEAVSRRHAGKPPVPAANKVSGNQGIGEADGGVAR